MPFQRNIIQRDFTRKATQEKFLYKILNMENNLQTFLQKSKTILNSESSNKDQKRHIVIGNEAGDADSLISALAYGFFLDSIDENATEKSFYHPVASIVKADLVLRQDTALLLKECGIDPDTVIFLDEVSEMLQFHFFF